MQTPPPPLPPVAVADDELGAHVSTRGGVALAPQRARAIGARVLQLFTKQPNRWAEPSVDEETARSFREARAREGIRVAGAHDSYLINLSSPDEGLRARSLRSFVRELERCHRLGLDFLVTHPGNATDGDMDQGVRRNAEAVTGALREVGEGPTRVLLELTAGSGTSVGGSFRRLAEIVGRIPSSLRHRVGVCVDTCHAWAAGYDLVEDYDGVWKGFERELGWDLLGLLHLNDSQHPMGSRRDRHQTLGEGTLGPDPFRRIMTDPRLEAVPKVLETPKGDDGETADRRNLAFLRAFRAG